MLRSVRTIACWLLATPWPPWAAMRLLGLDRWYPLVPLAAYTPYAAAAAVLAAIPSAASRRWVPAGLAAGAAAVLVVSVMPRAIDKGGSAYAAPGPRLRLLTANVSNGRASAEGLVRLVRRERPDALSVQELTPDMVVALDAAGI